MHSSKPWNHPHQPSCTSACSVTHLHHLCSWILHFPSYHTSMLPPPILQLHFHAPLLKRSTSAIYFVPSCCTSDCGLFYTSSLPPTRLHFCTHLLHFYAPRYILCSTIILLRYPLHSHALVLQFFLRLLSSWLLDPITLQAIQALPYLTTDSFQY